MKSLFLKKSLLVTALLVAFTSCSKEDTTDMNGQGPAITYPTSGFLSTNQGFATSSTILSFVVITNGDQMWEFFPGNQKSKDEVSMESNGNNTVSFRLKTPLTSQGIEYKYIGIKKNPNPLISAFPHEYIYFLAPQNHPPVEFQFVIKRSAQDGKRFTIESKAYPGNFLSTARWKNDLDIIEKRLVYTSKQQEFFLLSN